MSRLKCCVPGCFASGNANPILHTFPNPVKDKECFNSWVFAIGGEIIGLNNEFIFEQRRVCHAHFEDMFHCRNNRLSKNAIPTLNLRGLRMFSQVERTPFRALPLNSVPVSSLTLESPRPGGNILFRPEHSSVESVPSTSKEPPRLIPGESLLFRPEHSSVESAPSTSTVFVTMPQYEDKENVSSIMLTSLTKVEIMHEETADKNKIILKRKASSKLDSDHPIMKRFQTRSEKKLCQNLKLLRTKLSKLKTRVKKQAANLKAANNLVSNETFINLIEKMPNPGKLLTVSQFRECKKKDKGRRFQMNEKIVALSIFKRSPKCYRFLRKVFILPAPQTLAKVLQKAYVVPGINEKIFKQLKEVSKKMKIEHKLCALLFDEMALKANISFNERRDKITGFVTNGAETKPDFADHAQVFMLRGIVKNYKQAVSYTFSAAATKGPELAKQLKSVIKKVTEAGFIVVATICDQGTNNRQAIKLLIEETRAASLRLGDEPKDNIFKVDGLEIVPLYDPPHLLKCIRNNLMTKNLKYDFGTGEHIAKWDHLYELHQENPVYKGLRLVPKLTDYHVIHNKIPKMKVKYASQVFSQTVGANMGYLADKGILSKECKETADLLLFFDKLFDSMNGSYAKKDYYGKPLLQAVKPNSPHHKFWSVAKANLRSMKFIHKESCKVESVPTLNNCAWTLDGIQVLLKNLRNKYKIQSVWMRHLNQDPLENFFGGIRSHGCQNNNPTPENFSSAFTTLLINNMSSIHDPGANCENDFGETLHTFIITENIPENLHCEFEEIPDIHIVDVDQKKDPRILGPLQYVTGYFVQNAKKKIFKFCKVCNKNVVASESLEYIKYREFADKQWLCSPTREVIQCFSVIQDIQIVLKKILHTNNIKQFLKTLIIIHVNFDFIVCKEHNQKIIEDLIDSSCNFFIHHYCKNINRILNGVKDIHDSEDNFQLKARVHSKKMLKKR